MLTRLLAYRKWNFLFMTCARVLVFGVSFQMIGIVSRVMLDELSGARPLVFGPWLLCGGLVAVALARAVVVFIDVPLHFRTEVRTHLAAAQERPGTSFEPARRQRAAAHDPARRSAGCATT